MLSNQTDFMAYASALKSNYRKGVHKLETILANPTHAKEFAANLGGVSVVLGVPIGKEDRNSEELLELLLSSDVADDANETWLHQFYEFTDWDNLLSDASRCKAMLADPLILRAVKGSKLFFGKAVATLAGLSCSAYADIEAVAASSTAMTAVIGNSTALNAVVSSSTAMTAVIGNSTALNAVVSSSTAMTAVAASSTAMAAVAKSPVAVAAMWRSDSAIKVLQANTTAWSTFTGATSAVMGKAVAILADLNPSDYADMTAVAASSTAMAAVIGNSTALNAVVSSSTAMTAVIGNSTALNAVVSSSTAMAAVIGNSTALNAVVSSSTAMAAIVGSSTARNAITSSSTALTALAASPLKKTVTKGGSNSWETRTIRSGKGFLINCYNANSGGEASSTWYNIDNTQYKNGAGTVSVNRFFLTSLSIYWWSSTSSLTYIPC